MMKSLILACLITFIVFTGCASAQDCPEGINLLPMYGLQKKCAEQLNFDKVFLAREDSLYKNRKIPARYLIGRGWGYIKNGILDTAMMRFNQAWLLDSTNAEIYWGFGDILGMQHQYKNSIPFFEKTITMNPSNANLYADAATSYGLLYFETKDVNFLNKNIEYLKRCASIDPSNATAYGQLTASYSYFTQKDSARKYLELTDRLDSNAVNPEVRVLLNK